MATRNAPRVASGLSHIGRIPLLRERFSLPRTRGESIFAVRANRGEFKPMLTKRTVLSILLFGAAVVAPVTSLGAAAQGATPAPSITCEDVAARQQAGTPSPMMGDMAGMDMGTPMAEMDQMAMELDQIYIDMMIPHHASIVAMSQAALPRLENDRLQEIAQIIIDAQSAEIEELRGYREQFYGDPEPMPLDDAMMAAMMQMMPSMSGTMEEMAFQMNPAAQVAAICAAEDTDLAYIDMTIAHHQMAIEGSEPAVEGAANEEISEFAQRVIDDQQREIAELESIREELTGAGTPSA